MVRIICLTESNLLISLLQHDKLGGVAEETVSRALDTQRKLGFLLLGSTYKILALSFTLGCITVNPIYKLVRKLRLRYPWSSYLLKVTQVHAADILTQSGNNAGNLIWNVNFGVVDGIETTTYSHIDYKSAPDLNIMQCSYQYSVLITLTEISNIEFFGVEVVEIRPRGSVNDS